MIDKVLIYFLTFIEDAKSKGYIKAIRDIIFWNKPAIPVFIDCDVFNFTKYTFFSDDYALSQFEATMVNKFSGRYRKSRIRKAKYYLKKNYHALVILKNNQIIGDIWYVINDPQSAVTKIEHPDLNLLGITLKDYEAYAFDLYLLEKERGHNLSTFFMSSAIKALKEMGVLRVYGYYMKNNIPALWVHKLIGFRELPEVLISRFLFFRSSKIDSRLKML